MKIILQGAPGKLTMQLEGQTSVKGKYGSYQLLFLSLTLIFSLEK